MVELTSRATFSSQFHLFERNIAQGEMVGIEV